MNELAKSPRLWFFNNPDCAYFISEDTQFYKENKPDRIVEIATGSLLARYFNLDCPTDYPGIIGYINANWTLGDLSITPSETQVPLIFSPPTRQPTTTLGSALQALQDKTPSNETIDIFIEISLLGELLPWLHGFSGIGILYSMNFGPSTELVNTLKKVKEEGLLKATPWLGLWAYANENRLDQGSEQVLAIEESLNLLPKSQLITIPS